MRSARSEFPPQSPGDDGSTSGCSSNAADAEIEDWDGLRALLLSDWNALRENGARLVAANRDLWFLKAMRLGLYGIAAALAGIVTAAAAVSAVVFGVRGAAALLTEFYGGKQWAGDLTICAILVGVIVGGGIVLGRLFQNAVEKQIRERYAIRCQRREQTDLDRHGA